MPFIVAASCIEISFDDATGDLISIRGRLDPFHEWSPNLAIEGNIGWRLNAADNVLQPLTGRVINASVLLDGVQIEVELAGVDGKDKFVVDWLVQQRVDSIAISTRIRCLDRLELLSLGLTLEFAHPSLTGIFDAGITQNFWGKSQFLVSQHKLNSAYTVAPNMGSVSVMNVEHTKQTILWSSADPGASVAIEFRTTGLAAPENKWCPITEPTEVQFIEVGTEFEVAFEIRANNQPFPSFPSKSEFDSERSLRTHATALWASVVGCVDSLEIAGSSYPTIACPVRTYGTLHTFFDPDSWFVVASLSYSGESFLQCQARDILDRALSQITPAGQIPHHFDGEQPEYFAMSGARQPGPNLFWILAALDYVAATGDNEWLNRIWEPGIVAALEWIIQFYDSSRRLLHVEGPLWIDVFKKAGYTFDTNAMAVYVLTKVARAAGSRGDDESKQEFQQLATDIRAGLDLLWNGTDHYVTSISGELATIFDRVDSDNFLAVAFQIASSGRSAAIVRRMDSSANSHPRGRGTWVSELRYEADDCYRGNTGDSNCAMARLWWADLKARQALGDSATFRQMYHRVQNDLLALTWMCERYDEGGNMVRAAGYHEYPGVLDMMLREGLYGVTIDLERVEVSPMLEAPFAFRMGALALDYSKERVTLSVPGSGKRTYVVDGLHPHREYVLNGFHCLVSSPEGVATFEGEANKVHELVMIDGRS
jgi:hypothetical protein